MTAYPAGAADAKLELQLGGTWTDVTGRSSKSGAVEAQWTSGSPDAAQAPSPASFSTSLVNDDGALTPSYPLSPWYGQFGQNARARLSGGGPARLRVRDLASAGASCPDSAGLHAAGDIDVRADASLADWSGIIIGKNPSWQLQFDGSGLLGFAWGDGSRTWLAQAAVQPQPGRRCLRAVLALSTGIVTFYTAVAGGIDGSTWDQLGDPVDSGSGPTSVTTSGALLLGGGTPGDFWEGRLRIAGTVVANPSPASQAAGVTSFADGHSNTFTVGSHSEVSDRDYRLHGEVASNTRTAPPPLAQLQVAGPLRRLQRGSRPPVKSALRRAIEAQSGTLAPHAYWTWEDPAGSPNVSSAIGGPPMISDPARLPQFASDSSFSCSALLPQLASTALRGIVPAYTSHGSLIVRFLYKAGSTLGTPPAAGWPLVRASIIAGTVMNLDFKVYSGYGLGIQGGNASGSVFDSGAFNFGAGLPSGTVQGSDLWVSLELRPSGGNVNWALVTIYPGAPTAQQAAGSYAGSIGKAAGVLVHAGAMSDTVAGHFTVQSGWTSMFNLGQPLNAWSGELAGKRVQRLGGENGYDIRVIGAPGVTAAMGPQAVAPLAGLLGECQATDGGLLFEPRDSFSIGYRTLASMLNQAAALTMDYAAGEIPPAPSAADDDTAPLVNDWTVSGQDGASARVTLDDGSPKSAGVAGAYADTATVSVAGPAQLADVAGMLLARSTAAGPRYPSVSANLGLLSAAQAAAAAGVLPGDVVAMTSVPPTVAPDATVRQVTTGASEQLGPGRSADWNAVPASAYDVIVMDDEVLGRIEGGGVTLHAAAAPSDTTLVADPGGPAITTDPADCPVDVDIAGERVTVTAVSAGSSRTGAYLDQANFQQADYNGLAALWHSWTGQVIPVTRYYAGTNLSGYTTNLQEIVAAGARVCLSLDPAYNPPSSADLTAMTGLLATLKAAGADVIVTIRHEPFFGGLTAAQYVAAVQFYAPAMRAYYPFACCFSGNDAVEANGYYPGDAYVDGIACDVYLTGGFDYGDNSLVNAAAMADAHGKPLAVWEIGTTTGTNYFTGDNHSFAVGTGNWAAGANCGAPFHSTATNPFGAATGALGFAATAPGNYSVTSAAAANWATQMQACSPGDEITVGAWLQAGTTGRACTVAASFFTSAGAFVSTVASADASGTATDAAGTWTSVMGRVTAPATAAFYAATIQVASAAAAEVHRIGMAYGSDSTTQGHTGDGGAAWWRWAQRYMQGRVAAGLGNGDIILFNAGMPGNSNANAIQFAADYRIGLWQAVVAALDTASGPQRLTVTRAVNGIAKAHAAGEPVTLWTDPVLAPV